MRSGDGPAREVEPADPVGALDGAVEGRADRGRVNFSEHGELQCVCMLSSAQVPAPFESAVEKMLLLASLSATALSLSSAALSGVRGEPRSSRNAVIAPRSLCGRCARPHRVCICEALPPLPLTTDTKVLILQHPAEAKKRVATVPLIPLCVNDVAIVRGMRFSAELPELRAAVDDGLQPLLLYPGPGSEPLEAWAARRDSHDDAQKSKALLVLVDGTWTQAHHMLRHSPGLVAACERVRFSGAAPPSEFDPLRREPARGCVSTLEGHESSVWCVDALESGRFHYLASASADRLAMLWDASHHYPLRAMVGHHSDVNGVRFHPNGVSLLSFGYGVDGDLIMAVVPT